MPSPETMPMRLSSNRQIRLAVSFSGIKEAPVARGAGARAALKGVEAGLAGRAAIATHICAQSCRLVPGRLKLQLQEPRVKGVQLPQDLQPEKTRAWHFRSRPFQMSGFRE